MLAKSPRWQIVTSSRDETARLWQARTGDAIPGRPPDLVHLPEGCRFAARCSYVQERCRNEQPPLVEAETPGHLYRCWYPVTSIPVAPPSVRRSILDPVPAAATDAPDAGAV